MKRIEKLLAMLLCLTMMLSLFPATAFAQEAGEEQTETAACEHTPGEAVSESETEPTCTEPGSHDEVVYCSLCGEELSRETVEDPALGHTPEDVGEAASTCEKFRLRDCS